MVGYYDSHGSLSGFVKLNKGRVEIRMVFLDRNLIDLAIDFH